MKDGILDVDDNENPQILFTGTLEMALGLGLDYLDIELINTQDYSKKISLNLMLMIYRPLVLLALARISNGIKVLMCLDQHLFVTTLETKHPSIAIHIIVMI